jgi:hypothetical protein
LAKREWRAALAGASWGAGMEIAASAARFAFDKLRLTLEML